MRNKKFVMINISLSMIILLCLLVLYFTYFYYPMSDYVEEILGYTTEEKTLKAVLYCFTISITFGYVFTLYIGKYTNIIYKKEWKSLKLIRKEKKYVSFISPQGGGLSQYQYIFYFIDDKGSNVNLVGSTYEYECALEGAWIRGLVKKDQLLSIDTYS